jgi:ABC-2 type transport system ATP-binding protein
MDLDPIADGTEVRARTGVLTETHALDERLTGRENLEIFSDLYGIERSIARERLDLLLDVFRLSDRSQDRVRDYSKGMKQRLALARTIINDPVLLYLDEPTSGLDPVAAHEVREMIRMWGAAPDRTVFLCTHNLVEAQELCDRVGVLESGRLRVLGTPEELTNNQDGSVAVEVVVDPDALVKTIRVLRDHVQIDDASARDRVVVHLESRDAVPAFVKLTQELNLPLYGIVPREKTLRDVYLSMYLEDQDE